MATNDTKKARALAALLEQDSFTSAAKAAEISRRTLYNYLHSDAEFIVAYQQQRGQQTIERAERLAGERQKALAIVTEIMHDLSQPGAVRLKAAAQVIHEADEAQAKVDKLASGIVFDLQNPSFFF